MYFQKNNITQTLPPGIYTPDDFTNYADNFDLSLLSNDGEVPLSPQSQITSQTNQNNYQLQSSDYIPTTISLQLQKGLYENNNQLLTPTHSPQHQHYHHQPMKTESDWLKYSMNETSKQYNEDFLNELTVNYQYHYPSPLPSPPQENQYLSTSIYPPSPSNSSCSSASPHSTVDYNSINFPIKQEFGLQLPPSPPDSNGAPSPFNCCDIKTEPDTDNVVLIDIESLLNESYQLS
jgi:SAM pointed domain-containing ETS transcription factor